ncbi:hypothetical protein N781_06715 [Pontibacillus halophilus JSM 076056 = DSM 19796]|uniref:Uncharacterized protein n=1 Tax=Pontibacillus halophilus JSM 076056 = DSM 19796 TaxID=1385510 RepID=A0A0A5I4L5_9BACI|nr:hypothetical protein [Pontibacillus halophilus]KGX90767.1 hypothetical protein N781_06715 [Pontibacillus halophilus JSM 076056 = DSM 19796]
MTDSNKSKRDDNLVKKTASQANDLVNKSADTANDVVKSISGDGGLIGKVSDTSTDFVKNVSNTGNKFIGKSVDTATGAARGITKPFSRKKSKDDE